jgi:hypothetical protein
MSRKPKNLDLPGMSDRRIPELHEGALIYCGFKDEHKDLTEKLKQAKEYLKALMHKFNIKSYVFEGIEIYLEDVPADEELKVKVAKTAAPGGTPAESPAMTDQEFNEHMDAQEEFASAPMTEENAVAAGEPVSPQDGADFELPKE